MMLKWDVSSIVIKHLPVNIFVLLYTISLASAADTLLNLHPKAALLIIDVQDCFLPGGSLAVTDGDEVIPVINKIRSKYRSQIDLVVLSQDYHCPGHVSFASNHPGKAVMSTTTLAYNAQGNLCVNNTVTTRNFPSARDCQQNGAVAQTIEQVMWPDHCVQGILTGPTSAGFSPELDREADDVVVRKGLDCNIDSYSAFYDVTRVRQTNLHKILKRHEIQILLVTGLALDYCVKYTALDAQRLNEYVTYVVVDATRGVNPDPMPAVKELEKAGVYVIMSDDIGSKLREANVGNGKSSTEPSNLVTLLSLSLVCFLLKPYHRS